MKKKRETYNDPKVHGMKKKAFDVDNVAMIDDREMFQIKKRRQ